MFADFLQLVSRRPPGDYERRFVQEVSVSQRAPRNRRVERFLGFCWIVIGIKTVLVLWLFTHYKIPVNPLWVIAPTVVFAALCTVIYLFRD